MTLDVAKNVGLRRSHGRKADDAAAENTRHGVGTRHLVPPDPQHVLDQLVPVTPQEVMAGVPCKLVGPALGPLCPVLPGRQTGR